MRTLPSGGSRIFGLDLMRAVAILLVVFSHADDLLYRFFPVDPGVADVDGVDLFFVLSGYLIGGILLRTAEANNIPWTRRLLDFWQRRWFRTLPNYFLFLIINIVLVHYGIGLGLLNINVLAYFVFLQNFWIPLDLLFFESWSLAVEEWFYLIFPLLIATMVAVFSGKVRAGFLAAAVIMILIPTVGRFPAMDAVGTPFELDLYIRKIVVLRLDTIGFGILAAWVHHYYAVIWERWRHILFAIGIIAFAAVTMLRGSLGLMYMGTWYFTLSALAMAMMLPALSMWSSGGKWGAPVTFISRISYALYLVNLPVRSMYMDLLSERSLAITLAHYLGFWVVCIALSALVYRFWERPFMDLRSSLTRKLLGKRS